MKVSLGKTIAAALAMSAAIAATGPAAAETLCRIDGGAVYFSQNDASLDARSMDAINQIAAEARACDAAAVLIRTGQGALAEQRAETIRAELANRGVSATRASILPAGMSASETFIAARVAEIEIRATGQSVS